MHLHTFFHRSTHFFHWNFDFQQHQNWNWKKWCWVWNRRGEAIEILSVSNCVQLWQWLVYMYRFNNHTSPFRPHLSIQTTPLHSDHTFLLISVHWLCYSKCHLYFSQFPFWSHLWSPGPMFSVATATEAIASAWIKAYGPCAYYLLAS